MNPSEAIEQLSVAIYSPPLSSRRATNSMAELGDPVCVMMLVIDFDTELSMNGFVDGFLGNSTGRYAKETVSALRIIGASDVAEEVDRLLALAQAAGMTHEAIQDGRSGQGVFAITTFDQTHGSKWRDVSKQISQAAYDLDLRPMYDALERYAAIHLQPLLRALAETAP